MRQDLIDLSGRALAIAIEGALLGLPFWGILAFVRPGTPYWAGLSVGALVSLFWGAGRG